ncbi:MAG: extracellular solute-binding protein [Cetobacterium sp.]|uniref:extracellular solute-binding protein n=1 Tax=Cetobacterium sp. TaxID=2071632 RepID=UPI003F2A30B5
MTKRIAYLLAAIGMLQVNVFGSENVDYKITKKPTEMTILAIQNGKVYDESWSVFQEAFKDTNVKLKSASSKNLTDEMQAFNLAISSGKLPDIISLSFPDKLESLGMEGGMIPLNDLIDKHAPNIKAFFEKYPRYKMDAVAADGKIYFIPDYYDWYAMRAAQGIFIRQDWLDKLGLKQPQTMEEFYQVMKAFKEKDPNGNGIADEVPYFDRTTEFADKELLGLFGAEFGFYVDNGKVEYGPEQPRFKEAMKEVIKWYKEGLIDPEIFTRGFQGRDYMLRNDLGGVTFDWFASTTAYNTDKEILSKNKDFKFIAIAPPEYKGKRYAPDARTTYLGGWGITASAKDPVAAIKYFDYWFSQKGFELSNWGVEGDTFKRDANGKKYFTDKVMKADGKNPLQVLRGEGVQFRIGALQDYEYEKAWGNPQANEWAEMYMANDYVVDPMPTLKYTPEENKKIQKINSQLEMTLKEMSQKWILGAEDFDKTYNGFIKRLKEVGLDEAIKINQTAYDRFVNSSKNK